MKNGEKMSNVVNEKIKEELLEDVKVMAEDDIWSVIFAIQDEFGTHMMPEDISIEGFINQLVELRFEEKCV
jgi:hypothetical protein